MDSCPAGGGAISDNRYRLGTAIAPAPPPSPSLPPSLATVVSGFPLACGGDPDRGCSHNA